MRLIPRTAQLILLGAVLGTPVFADDAATNLARLPWIPLFDKTTVGLSLQYRVLDTPTGYLIAFRNTGTQMAHFSFWMKGWQPKAKALTNGRVHLLVGQESSPIQVQVTPGHPPAQYCPIKLLNVALGDASQGPFWMDEQD